MARKGHKGGNNAATGGARGSVLRGWASPMNVIPPAGGKSDPVGSATYPPNPAMPKDSLGVMPSGGKREK